MYGVRIKRSQTYYWLTYHHDMDDELHVATTSSPIFNWLHRKDAEDALSDYVLNTYLGMLVTQAELFEFNPGETTGEPLPLPSRE